ncbi:MAG: transcriptional repressor [Nitrospirae bacterium]|nr:transcriptional repressor [Nitrospirota bacterium]MBI5694741.1 transcriptional repressor [Nitrospirota bacterium]
MEGKTVFKMTPQRAAILEYLDGNTSHPSAEDIYSAIQKKYPMMSFATVYNTLEALKAKGMLWELNIDDQRKRYDPNTKLHHHLICEKCRAVVDIFKDFDLTVPADIAQGFMITGKHVEFYGLCPDCAKNG